MNVAPASTTLTVAAASGSREDRCARRFGGFTLLEVLLALAIATVMLAGVLMALSAYAQHVRGGQRRVELAALGRAVLTDIERDLRALVRPGDHSSMAPAKESGKPRGASDRQAVVEPMPSRVLFGDAEGLILRIHAGQSSDSVPGSVRPLRSADGDKPPTKTKLVAHYLLRNDQVTSPALQKTASAALPRRSGMRAAVGLLRAEALAPPAEIADPTRALADLPWSGASDLDQVVGLRFRYFDGRQWLDHWDNMIQRALPTAVEIEVSLAERPESETRGTTAAALIATYRLLVTLPVADDVPTSRAPGLAMFGFAR